MIRSWQWFYAYVYVLTAAVGCTAAEIPKEEASPPDPLQQCYTVAETIKLHGFDRSKPQCLLAIAATTFDEQRLTQVTGVKSTDYDRETIEGLDDQVVGSLFTFSVDKETHEILGIYSKYGLMLARQERERVENTWPRKTVVQKARDYVMQLAPGVGDLEVGAVRFDHKYNSSTMSWRVCLFRTHDGYSFKKDYINIYIHETYGLLMYYRRFFSEPAAAEPKIAAADAKEEAERVLQELLKEAGVDPGREKLNILCRSTDTLYVNPALHQYKASRVAGMSTESALLAHEFIFTVTAYKDKPELKEKWKATVEVCVDAETGEYVCANSNL